MAVRPGLPCCHLTTMTGRLLEGWTIITVVLLINTHLSSAAGFCSQDPVPYCTCHNNTLSVNCSGKNVTSLPASYPQSIMILNLDGADLEVLETVPYDHLQTLSLENCGIRYIKSGALSNLAYLRFFYLTNNEISGLTNATFAGLKNLSVIKISVNPLYVLKHNVFSYTQTPNLKEIRLEECLLYHVEPKAFALLNQLEYLNLSFNYLRQVPVFHQYDDLGSLHTLDLSGNLIQALAGSGLLFLTNLQSLFLHSNRMERVTRKDMLGLHETVRVLDLSKNSISWIEATAFTELHKLSELYLEGNAITSLYWEEMPWDSLNKLTLMNNPWDCSCNNSWMVEGNYPHIEIVNNNDHTKCASPPAVAGQPVFSVPHHTFACKVHHSSRKALTAVFAMVVSLIGIAAIVVIVLRVRKRRKRNYQQPYTKVTVNGGIHM